MAPSIDPALDVDAVNARLLQDPEGLGRSPAHLAVNHQLAALEQVFHLPNPAATFDIWQRHQHRSRNAADFKLVGVAHIQQQEVFAAVDQRFQVRDAHFGHVGFFFGLAHGR